MVARYFDLLLHLLDPNHLVYKVELRSTVTVTTTI